MWGIWASSAVYGWVYGLVLIRFNPEAADAGDGSDPKRLFIILTAFTAFFGVAHYAEGIFLSMVFPITRLEGWALFGYPIAAFSWYWGVIVTTFYSRWAELVSATRPSEDPHRLLAPFKSIAQMQVMVFLLLFVSAVGLIRFAVYPVLFFYFFPSPILREKAKYLLGKWEDYMDPVLGEKSKAKEPLDDLDEIEEFDDSGK